MSIWYRVQHTAQRHIMACIPNECSCVIDDVVAGVSTAADIGWCWLCFWYWCCGGGRQLQLCVAGGSSGETCSGHAVELVLCLVLVLVLMRTLVQMQVLVLVLVASDAARLFWCIVKLQRTCFGAGSVCGVGGVAVGYSSVQLMHQQL